MLKTQKIIEQISIKMFKCTIICWIVCIIMLYTILSEYQYTYFWKGKYDKISNKCKVDLNKSINKDSYLFKEMKCVTKSNKYISKLINTPPLTKSIKSDYNLCTILLTRNENRIPIDYFNTTLASLLYEYNMYINSYKKTDKNIQKTNINMELYIVINNAKLYNQKEKLQFIKRLSKNMEFIKYSELLINNTNWKKSLVFSLNKSLELCKQNGYNIALVLEEDILIGNNFFNYLENIMNEIKNSKNWFLIKLFYTEFWLGWNKEFRILISLGILYCISCYLYRLIWFKYSNIYDSEYVMLMHNRMKLVYFILMVLSYLLFGLLVILFVIGIGKQNIIEPLRFSKYHKLYGFDKINQKAMNQANIYNLKHLNEFNIFTKSNHDMNVDILVSEFSLKFYKNIWTYIPSIAQHIGRTSTNPRKKCELIYLKKSMTFVGSQFCDFTY